MANQYGHEAFTKAYAVVKSNQDLIYDDQGEVKLNRLLKGILRDDQLIQEFLNFSTSFLIVQNLNYDSYQ